MVILFIILAEIKSFFTVNIPLKNPLSKIALIVLPLM